MDTAINGQITGATFLEIAKGNLAGHSILRKFGKNIDIDTASEETIWDVGGNVVFEATATTVSIVSSSGQDAVAGTGLAKIKIQGLDANFAEQEEEITLTGTTPVVSTKSYLRLFRAFGFSSSGTALGSSATYGATNVGIITFTQTTVTAQISAGVGQTLMAIYTVPADTTLIMYAFEVGVLNGGGTGAKAAEVHLHTIDCVSQNKRMRGIVSVQNNGGAAFSSNHSTVPYLTISEKTDIVCEGLVTNNNTDVFASFSGILIKNKYIGI